MFTTNYFISLVSTLRYLDFIIFEKFFKISFVLTGFFSTVFHPRLSMLFSRLISRLLNSSSNFLLSYLTNVLDRLETKNKTSLWPQRVWELRDPGLLWWGPGGASETLARTSGLWRPGAGWLTCSREGIAGGLLSGIPYLPSLQQGKYLLWLLSSCSEHSGPSSYPICSFTPPPSLFLLPL